MIDWPDIDLPPINLLNALKVKNMTLLEIAKIAIYKRMDYEELKYSDYLYGQEHLVDDVWEYVQECYEIGTKAFYEKYPN